MMIDGRRQLAEVCVRQMTIVVQLCGYKTKSATRKIIAGLVRKKLIEKQGSGPATRYVLTKE